MNKSVSVADHKLVVKSAYIHYLEGRWVECISEFRQLVALVPEDSIARNMLGDALARTGALAEARDQYVIAAFGYMVQGEAEKVREIGWKLEALNG